MKHKEDKEYYLAIDIGATSGRHIVGWEENGEIAMQEVYRFPTGAQNERGHLIWDIGRLYAEVLAGIRIAFKKYHIVSLAVDTWGVDYVLMRGDEPVLPVYSYRDNRTKEAIGRVHSLVPFETLYGRTGIQYQPFNTIYQLYDDLSRGRLEGVTDFLMLPAYFTYLLTGVKAHEYTNATTTGLVNARTGRFDEEIIAELKFPKSLFPPLTKPGTVVGRLTKEAEEACGGNCRVIFCASHDTGSAVEGIPIEGDEPYLSSGTWSLLGLKVPAAITDEKSRAANYSNEGGVGYIRYQKNIMGMWVVNRLKEEFPEMTFGEVVSLARASGYKGVVDINDETFLAPKSMKEAFDSYLESAPKEAGDYFKCAFTSLAYGYKKALDELSENTGKKFAKLYIVGGGAKNDYLNELTEKICGVEVIALPIEATAIGNLKIQMRAQGRK